jgi:Protein of unknown function (DUF2806)
MDDPPTPEEQDVPEQQFGSALVRKIAESILGRLVETLPVRVARNLVKAVEVTLVGGVGIWEEQLASWRAGIKAKSDARAEAWLAAGQAAGEAVKGDPELGVRAAHSLLGNAIKDQQRREDVVKYTAQALHDDPPAKDANEDIDEDWLLLFTRVAERISKRDLQEILGRMLAGEIKKPGTISPFTLQIMTTLTPDIANTFQTAVNLSMAFADGQYSILTAPFGGDSSNALERFDLPYYKLKTLETVGLVLDVSGWRQLKLQPRTIVRTKIADKTYRVINDTENEVDFGRTPCVHFSQAGAELLGLLAKSEVPDYVLHVKEFFEKKGASLLPE